MTIREFGQQKEKILLFFPGSCEPWQEFAYAARELAARYHVLLVTPDGHDPEEHTDFISIEKTVDDTVRWLKAHSMHGEYVMMHPKEFSAQALAFFEN